MSKKHTIGLVTPQAVDRVPAEGAQMYPDVNFIPKGVGVRVLMRAMGHRNISTTIGYIDASDDMLRNAVNLA